MTERQTKRFELVEEDLSFAQDVCRVTRTRPTTALAVSEAKSNHSRVQIALRAAKAAVSGLAILEAEFKDDLTAKPDLPAKGEEWRLGAPVPPGTKKQKAPSGMVAVPLPRPGYTEAPHGIERRAKREVQRGYFVPAGLATERRAHLKPDGWEEREKEWRELNGAK